jgi:ribosomal protein S18 acetylase RimI-like enzyme
MNIRSAVVGDARAIADVHVLSWQHAYSHMLPRAFLAALSVEQREAMWSEALRIGRPSLLVAEANGQVVGFSACGPCRDENSKPTDAEVWAIYLAPSKWSMGLGRQLWLRSKEALQSQGATNISLWVVSGNERAINFYTAAGFSPEPCSAKAFELGGVQLHEVRYVRKLSQL